MSRLIVKNLPNKVTVEKLKEIFSEKGEVTDVQLKFTKDGKFRNFGFVGYRTEQQAEAAREHFHNTCIQSMKISVELCAALGDEKKPRAWSKYATDSSAFKKLHKILVEEPMVEKKTKKKKVNKVKELLEKHKDDPMFAEFIEAHVTEQTAWIKEALEAARRNEDSGVEEEDNDDDDDDDVYGGATVKDSESDKPEVPIKDKVADKGISDLEYMKAIKKKKTPESEEMQKTEEKPKKIRQRPLFHVKMTGLPFKCKKRDVKEFFRPLVPYSLRFPLGKGERVAGFCFVGFRTEEELRRALNKDKLFIAGHRVHVQKYEDKAKKEAEEKEEQNKKKLQQMEQNEESIGESGRIFVRNLPYIVTEDEITKLFETYGKGKIPISLTQSVPASSGLSAQSLSITLKCKLATLIGAFGGAI